MTEVQRLARFVARARFEDLSEGAISALRARILDALGCAVGALGAAPTCLVREQVLEFGGMPLATLIGGGQSAPDRAAFHNGALVRYLDFNDSFLAPRETSHPSDNLAPVLAACEYAGASGRTLLLALAVAYQVQCRLCEAAPVRDRGFDHATQGAYAVSAGVGKALGLDEDRLAHAIAMAGTANNPLRVTRTGTLSHWKGLAYPQVAQAATFVTFLAARGITGPLEVFEGNKGFREAISGDFSIDWEREDLEIVRRTSLKRYNAEVHSQSAIEGLLELMAQRGFRADDIAEIGLTTFDVAHRIIGGGEEGDKQQVATKEQADHSLPYLLAVAALDGAVGPEQYAPERIRRPDVQQLMGRVVVTPSSALSRRFPEEMPAVLRVTLGDGRSFGIEKADYEGFHSRPMRWEQVVEKFDRLATPFMARSERLALVEAISTCERREVTELLAGLSGAGMEEIPCPSGR